MKAPTILYLKNVQNPNQNFLTTDLEWKSVGEYLLSTVR